MTDLALGASVAREERPAAPDRWLNLLLLLPGCGFLFVAMALPAAQLVLASFGIAGIGTAGRFTLQNYIDVYENVLFTSAFRFSLQIAVAASMLSVAFATLMTAVLQIDFPGRRLVSLLCKVPLVVPSLVAAFMVLTIIGPGGMAARLVGLFGLQWPSLLTDPSGAGIVLVLLWNAVPTTILIISAVAASIPRDVIEAARTLGASPWHIFVKIMVPLCAPGISAAGLLVFIGCFGTFAIPSLVGPAFPRAISVMMTNEFLLHANWGTASVVGVAMVVTTALVLALYYAVAEHGRPGASR